MNVGHGSAWRRKRETLGDRGQNTHVFAILIVVGVLDFVKVILVQLPDERGKVGVFEHPRQDRFCELVHVLDDKTVPSGTPRNDMLEVWIFEHPKIMIRLVQSVASNRRNGK